MWFITADLDLVINHQVGIVFRVLHLLFPSHPFPSLHSLKSVTTCSLSWECGELHTTSLRAENLHKLFGILLHWRFVYSPAFIYLLNNFFMLSGFIDIYFTLLLLIQYYFILLLKIFQLWPLGTFSWLLCPFDIVLSMIFCLFVLFF